MTKKTYWVFTVSLVVFGGIPCYFLDWGNARWIIGTLIPLFISLIIFFGFGSGSPKVLRVYFIFSMLACLLFGFLLSGKMRYELIGGSFSMGAILLSIVGSKVLMPDIYRRQIKVIKETWKEPTILPKRIIELVAEVGLPMMFQFVILVPALLGLFAITSPKGSQDVGQQFWDGNKTETKKTSIIWSISKDGAEIKNAPAETGTTIGTVSSSNKVLRIDLLGPGWGMLEVQEYFCPVLTLTFFDEPVVGWVDSRNLKEDDKENVIDLRSTGFFLGTIFNLMSLRSAVLDATLGFSTAIVLSFLRKNLREYLGLISSLVAIVISLLTYVMDLHVFHLLTKIYMCFIFPQMILFPWLFSTLWVKLYRWIGFAKIREDDMLPW